MNDNSRLKLDAASAAEKPSFREWFAVRRKAAVDSLRKWIGEKHVVIIPLIVIIMLLGVALLPNRQMPPSAVPQGPVVGRTASDSAAIGDAVGATVQPFLTRHGEGINLLKKAFQELEAQQKAASGRLDKHDAAIENLQGGVKTLGEQKFDKKDFDKAIEPYLKKIPELMSQIDTLKGQAEAASKEAAAATANFPKRATA